VCEKVHAVDAAREQFRLNLLQHRQRLGLTQEGLAKASDLDRSEVGLLERGEYYPRLDTLVKLARGLKLDSPSELLAGISLESTDRSADA
jgi:transcriptional regulator with XRE-family HTH domain